VPSWLGRGTSLRSRLTSPWAAGLAESLREDDEMDAAAMRMGRDARWAVGFAVERTEVVSIIVDKLSGLPFFQASLLNPSNPVHPVQWRINTSSNLTSKRQRGSSPRRSQHFGGVSSRSNRSIKCGDAVREMPIECFPLVKPNRNRSIRFDRAGRVER